MHADISVRTKGYVLCVFMGVLVSFSLGCGGEVTAPDPIAAVTPATSSPVPGPVAPDRTPGPSDGGYTAHTFPSDPGPADLIFDGEYIWVAHPNIDTVSKWSLDGSVVGRFPSGAHPRALAFDGEHIWVGTADDNSVTKLSRDGQVLATTRIGTGRTAPSALAFDGHHIWVAAAWGNSLTKLSLDGAVLRTVAIPGFHPSPWDLAWDGKAVWVISMGTDEVHKVDQTGRIVGAFQVAEIPEEVQNYWLYGGSGIPQWARGWTGGPTSALFDGESIWLATASSNSITKLSIDGDRLADFTVEGMPLDILYDGENIWVARSLAHTVARLRPDGTLLDTYEVDRGPYALAFDGEAIWVSNHEANTVTKLVRNDD